MKKTPRPESLVVLVPGFFGFNRIGPIGYFQNFERSLIARLARRGVKARAFVARPDPAGGLRARAETLLDQVGAEIDRAPARKVHFVGHSAGGLDIRFAFDPGFRIRDRLIPPARRNEIRDRLRERLGARVSISAPHRGTPFAVPFALIGPGALESKLPLAARLVIRLVRLGVKPDSDLKRWLGLERPILDSLAENLGFRDAPIADVRHAVEFVLSILEDRDGIGDLTPTVLRRAVQRDPRLGAGGPDCSSILTFLPAPALRARAIGSKRRAYSPQRLAFSALWAITAYSPCLRDWPPMAPARWRRLAPRGAPVPDPRTNDGIVPTLSQPWGEIAGVFRAGHPETIGMTEPFSPGTGLSRREFTRLVGIIADRIARAEDRRGAHQGL